MHIKHCNTTNWFSINSHEQTKQNLIVRGFNYGGHKANSIRSTMIKHPEDCKCLFVGEINNTTILASLRDVCK